MREIDLIFSENLSLETFMLYFKEKKGDLSLIEPYIPKLVWEDISNMHNNRERELCLKPYIHEMADKINPQQMLSLIVSGLPCPSLQQKFLDEKNTFCNDFHYFYAQNKELFLLNIPFDTQLFVKTQNPTYFDAYFEETSNSIFFDNECLHNHLTVTFLKNIKEISKDSRFSFNLTLASYLLEELSKNMDGNLNRLLPVLNEIKKDLSFWSNISFDSEYGILERLTTELI